MLRYICVLSLSIFKLWGSALPTETPAAPPQPQQQHKEHIVARILAGYCVVTTEQGRLRFHNDPYRAPLQTSNTSMQLFVHQSFQEASFESAHALAMEATASMNLHPLSQKHYEEIVSKYFDFLMDHFQKKYANLRLARANLTLFSSYRHVCQNTEQVRTLPMFSVVQQHRLTCYKITFLMGAANVAGKLHNNQEQLNLATEAKALIEALPYDIDPAYVYGGSLRKTPTLRTCNTIIARAAHFLQERPMFLAQEELQSAFTEGNQW